MIKQFPYYSLIQIRIDRLETENEQLQKKNAVLSSELEEMQKISTKRTYFEHLLKFYLNKSIKFHLKVMNCSFTRITQLKYASGP